VKMAFSQADQPISGLMDSTLVLPVAIVVEEPLRANLAGSRRESWNGSALEKMSSAHLGDLLSQESGVFVKSYGAGSSATTSIRGAGAGHTSVLWNGLPLQSPMLGQLDFSLLPISLIDGVQLECGGNTAAWGSGAIGGVIGLQNQADFDKKMALSFRSSLGSFGLFDQQFKGQYGKDKWRGATRVFHQQADNDFPYRLRSDLPEKQQNHAALKQSGILQEFYWRPSQRQQLALHIWAQQSDREIPPTTVQNRSEAVQDDRFIRTALHWKAVGKDVVWQVRAGVFRENLDYRDDLILLASNSTFWTTTAEMEGEWYLNPRQKLLFGLGHTWMQAEADAYETDPQQHRTAPFAAFRQYFGRWHVQANLRQEVVDGRLVPLVPGLGLEGEVTDWLRLRAKITRNYRLPTFNDLYWQPGGNTDLLPESGWSEEATIQTQWQSDKHKWFYSFTGFNRQIDNWILWSIREGQSFWSPDNIARVWSRGLEQRLTWMWTAEKWSLKLAGGYDYILSTNEIAIDNPRLEAGAQLIYVPRHQAFGKLRFSWKDLEAEYRHRYTGSVSTQNIASLPGYQLGFFSVAYTLNFSQWNTQLFFNLNNVWDESYRVIERRVMPGRNVQMGVKVQFEKK